tara:strand:- start:310 stop:1671 length:1362 start_codon:yes stop_codon:yes gene_type:complete
LENSSNNLKRSGYNFLSLLNDIKRRPEDAANELGVEIEEINAIIEGRKEISFELILKAISVWPLNPRDFFIINDDCPNGVKIMRSEESIQSSRIMDRGGFPYYEYRDTAMSSVSLFRPEWIEELCYVDNNDTENTKVQWNKGHFMHQFTYFIGDVNYYYIGEDNQKKVFVTKTGDSVYGTPFRPHTFTTRIHAEKNGLILALTYGNKIAADTQQELSAIGPELGIQYHLDFETVEKAFSSILKFSIDAASISVEELSNRTGIEESKINEFLIGTSPVPGFDTIQNLAKALSVNSRDLLPPDIIEDKILSKTFADSKRWYYPSDSKAYEMIELSQSCNLPFSKSLEINILEESNDILDLKVGLHQWLYNIGESPIRLNWKLGEKIYQENILSNDSVYIKPFVEHSMRGSGKLMVLRIGGRMTGDAQREFSNLSKHDAHRAINETQMWFDAKTKH